MIREVIIKPDAEQDIDAAFVWYEKARDNLGFEFLLSLDAVFQSISRDPFYPSYLYKNVRSASLPRFPYQVIFVLEENKVFVLGVIHHSRNPSEWQMRS